MGRTAASEPQERGQGARLWIVLIGIGSIFLSRAFACTTPFATLATLGALTLDRREAFVLLAFVWAANQAVGFGLLHYPHDATTIAWGAVVGVAAFGGLAAAHMTAGLRLPTWAAVAVGLVASYTAYEEVLSAATWPLASGWDAFTASIVFRIFATNAAALALLLVIHRAVGALGWPVGARLVATTSHAR